MSRPTPPTYKTRDWPAYNEALKRRGSLTIWFDPEMTWEAAPTGRRGRHQTYCDSAIQTCLTMKVLFGMALRQTTGFVESLGDPRSRVHHQRYRRRAHAARTARPDPARSGDRQRHR